MLSLTKTVNNLKNSTIIFPKINMSTFKKSAEEIQIPVPWGHIAGKWWGAKNNRPILCLHGWQDNCGTFDPLIQHLPSNLSYLAIDFPGHGLSSKLPPGLYYNGFDLVILLRRILNYFQWQKLSLIGHSLGGITSYLYASTFPETVEFLICFDTITPMTEVSRELHCDANVIEKFLFYDELNNTGSQPPSYPYENLDKILYEGSRRSVDLDKCKYLITRNIQQSKQDPNKYYFTRDPRAKCQFFLSWFYTKLKKDGHKMDSPAMEVEGTNHLPTVHDTFVYNEIMECFKENNELFQKQKINGTHHLHLNNPEEVSTLINPFILKYFNHPISKY